MGGAFLEKKLPAIRKWIGQFVRKGKNDLPEVKCSPEVPVASINVSIIKTDDNDVATSLRNGDTIRTLIPCTETLAKNKVC